MDYVPKKKQMKEDENLTKQNEEMNSIFFQAIRTKSLVELREMLQVHGETLMTNLAQSYTDERQTALLLAIQNRHLNIVKFLIEELNAPQDQTGNFQWKGQEYFEVLPLFVAIISDQLCTIKYLASLKIPDDFLESFFSDSKNRLGKLTRWSLWGPRTSFKD